MSTCASTTSCTKSGPHKIKVARLSLRELSSPITPSLYFVAAGACDVTIGWGDGLMLVPAHRRELFRRLGPSLALASKGKLGEDGVSILRVPQRGRNATHATSVTPNPWFPLKPFHNRVLGVP